MGARVLIVEDEPDIRDLLAFHLEREGYQVTRSRSGADALRQVRALPPDRGGRIPAAALTAYATLEDRRKALLAGYNEHLPKPVDPTRLIATVAELLGQAPPTVEAPAS